MAIQAGRLRHRIELQQKSVTLGNYNEEIITWITQDTVWASIEPLIGNEYYLANQMQADVSHRIRMRYYSEINPEWRIKFGTRTFNISTIINPEERNRELVLMAREALT